MHLYWALFIESSCLAAVFAFHTLIILPFNVGWIFFAFRIDSILHIISTKFDISIFSIKLSANSAPVAFVLHYFDGICHAHVSCTVRGYSCYEMSPLVIHGLMPMPSLAIVNTIFWKEILLKIYLKKNQIKFIGLKIIIIIIWWRFHIFQSNIGKCFW